MITERSLFYVLTLAAVVVEVVVEGLFSLLHFLFSTPTLIRHLGGPVYWLCWKAAGYINICAARSQQCSVTQLFPRETEAKAQTRRRDGRHSLSLSLPSLCWHPVLPLLSELAASLYAGYFPVTSRQPLKSVLLSHLIKSLPFCRWVSGRWFYSCLSTTDVDWRALVWECQETINNSFSRYCKQIPKFQSRRFTGTLGSPRSGFTERLVPLVPVHSSCVRVRQENVHACLDFHTLFHF